MIVDVVLATDYLSLRQEIGIAGRNWLAVETIIPITDQHGTAVSYLLCLREPTMEERGVLAHRFALTTS